MKLDRNTLEEDSVLGKKEKQNDIEKNKNVKKQKSKKSKFLILFIVLLLLAGGGFFLWKVLNGNDKTPSVKTAVELDNLTEYGYKLTDKDSKYFKAEFEQLKKVLNDEDVNIEDYTSQVAKMFIIDLYTLSTKVNKYDIGGIEYFYVDKQTMFEQKVMDTLYSSLLDNTYGDRKQELPEVKEVVVLSNEKSTYELGKEKVDSYVIKANISYVKDLGYDDEVTIVLCKEEGNRWSVVDIQPKIEE